MRIIAWNSRGNKWQVFVDSYFGPNVGDRLTIGLLTESGWPPWMASGDVKEAPYQLDDSKSYHCRDSKSSAFTASLGGIGIGRRTPRTAYFTPWVKDFEAKTNTRCSQGGIMYAPQGCSQGFSASRVTFGADEMSRPSMRLDAGVHSGGSGQLDVKIVIFPVHLTSGNYKAALKELVALLKNAAQIESPILVVGDLNINLQEFEEFAALQSVLSAFKGQIIRTGVGTHDNGGELDFAVLIPKNISIVATAVVIEAAKTGSNDSDHAVVQYDFKGGGLR